jgi:D-alanyl-D-alanine dipeptidase
MNIPGYYMAVPVIWVLAMYAGVAVSGDKSDQLPDGFVYASDIVPDIVCELRYFGELNFAGRRINGYKANKCILTREAAYRLKEVQDELRDSGSGLKILDAYRPQRSVRDIVNWARDIDDINQKAEYYPDINKEDLFAKGYIAQSSGHSRGSTVDLTIVVKGAEIDMGSPFDFFGKESGVEYQNLTPKQRANRALLKNLMEAHGFKSYRKEWWHFVLVNEPYPDRYFDFPVR